MPPNCPPTQLCKLAPTSRGRVSGQCLVAVNEPSTRYEGRATKKPRRGRAILVGYAVACGGSGTPWGRDLAGGSHDRATDALPRGLPGPATRPSAQTAPRKARSTAASSAASSAREKRYPQRSAARLRAAAVHDAARVKRVRRHSSASALCRWSRAPARAFQAVFDHVSQVVEASSYAEAA